MLRNQIKHHAFLNRFKKKKHTWLRSCLSQLSPSRSIIQWEWKQTNKETPQTKLSFQKPACPSEQGRNSMQCVAGAAVLFVLLKTAAAGPTA